MKKRFEWGFVGLKKIECLERGFAMLKMEIEILRGEFWGFVPSVFVDLMK